MKWNQCGHCGREGALESVEDVTFSSRTVEFAAPGGGIDWIDYQERIEIKRCTICGKPTVRSYSWNDYSDPTTDDLGLRTLYPPDYTLADLPSDVSKRYAAMLEMLYAPDAFAVRAGKLLEAVCRDMGVAQKTLHQSLERLARSERLPDALAAQVRLVKEYRNIGGHADALEVEPEDVPVLRDFVENLLEALYWGPGKFERGQQRLDQRRAAHLGDAEGGAS